MNSPKPALSPTAVGNLVIVRLPPQYAAAPLAPSPQAANDAAVTELRPIAAPTAAPVRISLAVALAVGFWMFGTLILATLALAYRLVA